MDSRAALGEEFGTKKSRKVIREREANKVDVSQMEESLSTSIVSQVGEKTKSMPTKSELEKSVMEGRELPPVNPDAELPTQVYNIDDIISPAEMADISVRTWFEAAEKGTPPKFRNSQTHVIARIPLFTAEKNAENTRRLKILKYISWLIDFYQFVAKTRGFGREKAKRAVGVDGVLLDGFLQRYTKKEGGRKEGEEKWVKLYFGRIMSDITKVHSRVEAPQQAPQLPRHPLYDDSRLQECRSLPPQKRPPAPPQGVRLSFPPTRSTS